MMKKAGLKFRQAFAYRMSDDEVEAAGYVLERDECLDGEGSAL